jgi:hypothetical protein
MAHAEAAGETGKTVKMTSGRSITPLKRGVNERGIVDAGS